MFSEAGMSLTAFKVLSEQPSASLTIPLTSTSIPWMASQVQWQRLEKSDLELRDYTDGSYSTDISIAQKREGMQRQTFLPSSPILEGTTLRNLQRRKEALGFMLASGIS